MATYEADGVWAVWKNQWIVTAMNSASFFLQEIIGMTWSSFVSLCLQGGGTPAVCSSASDTSLPVTIALEKQRSDYINKYMERDCNGYLLRGEWQHRWCQFGCEWSNPV